MSDLYLYFIVGDKVGVSNQIFVIIFFNTRCSTTFLNFEHFVVKFSVITSFVTAKLPNE